MQILNNKIIELIADDGNLLTNDNINYCTHVYLSINDSPFNWHEVSIEEVQNGEFAENNLFN